mmetsp:Transcript_20429/g.36661  ORF Transcript_20429/g.36661 Transcript_20429/m.36661 type:complete len:188 (+) Transcript_20429:109-672(+)
MIVGSYNKKSTIKAKRPLFGAFYKPHTNIGCLCKGLNSKDLDYLYKAYELAKRGLGSTYPNPAVGCVIVKDQKIVGEGYHPKAGMPHAEVYALRAAGLEQAKDATAYVTLEPCAHFGRTPPCSRALVQAGVKKVVVGVLDPNPLVSGKGITILKKAGIEVEEADGVIREKCWKLNEEFMRRMGSLGP